MTDIALDEIRRRVRNIWGAISSNQVIDKDVEGQAKQLLEYVDDLRRASPTQVAPANPAQVTDAMVERACRVHNVGWSKWHEPQKKTAREVMRSAITAAMGAGEQVAAEPAREVNNKAAEGRQAYKGGQSKDSNPYPKGTAKYWQWSSGWLDAQTFRPIGAGGQAVADEISPYEWLAQEFDRLAILRKMWTADEVAATIRRHDIERPALSQPHPADERVVEALAALRIDRDNEAERKARARHNKDTTMIAVHAYAEGVLAGHVKSFEAALSAKECR